MFVRQITSSERQPIIEERPRKVQKVAVGGRNDPNSLDNDYSVNHQAKCELDTRADTIVAGANTRPLAWTGMKCSVSGFSSSMKSVDDVPVATVATAYTTPEGMTLILIFNEALFFGSKLDHSLINPNQIRSFLETPVCDDPFDPFRPLGIDHSEAFIPFETEGSCVYFDSWVPSDEDLDKYPHVVLTNGDVAWDPKTITLGHKRVDKNDEFLRQVKAAKARLDEAYIRESDLMLGSISSSYLPQEDVAARMISQVKVERNLDGSHSIKAVSRDRHSKVTPERVMDIFSVGIDRAKHILSTTTQAGVRTSLHPLIRRYRVDNHHLHRRKLNSEWQMDWLTARHRSLSGNTGAYVLTNGHFTSCYPKPKDDQVNATASLRSFVDEVGVPSIVKSDLARSFSGKNTDFVKYCQKNDITQKFAEAERPHQIRKVDVEIRELKKRVQTKRTQKNIPNRIWDYVAVNQAELMRFIPRQSLQGRNGHEEVTGSSADISEYLDFDIYDTVWYWREKHPSISASSKALGKWLGVAHRVGSDMCYWILTVTGDIIAETTVQHVTREDLDNPSIATQVKEFDDKLNERLNDTNFKLATPDEYKLLENFDMPADPAYGTDDTTPNSADYDFGVEDDSEDPGDLDTFIGAHLVFTSDQNNGGDIATRPAKAKVLGRSTDTGGNKIGSYHKNPLLSNAMYDVEYEDGTVDRMFANAIAENIWSQTDDEGRVSFVMKEITGHRYNNRALSSDDAWIISNNGERKMKKTTDGVEIEIEWNDGSTDWLSLAEVKQGYPLQLAEYAIANKIADTPQFRWWVPTAIRKRDRIIQKAKTKYWRTTLKFGIRVPKSVEEALEIDKANKNTLWQDALAKEMKRVKVAFVKDEKYMPKDARNNDAPEYRSFKEISCHMVFDIKMNFDRKCRFVANGSTTEALEAITYSSVVDRDSVRIAFLIAALNDLEVSSCDIANAYLNAECREKIWFEAGPELGADEGCLMRITRALYGLKVRILPLLQCEWTCFCYHETLLDLTLDFLFLQSSGAAWRAMFSHFIIHQLGFSPTVVDSDVYLRKRTNPETGMDYYEYLLCYVDDVLLVSHDPKDTMEKIKAEYRLKDDAYGSPETYLGAEIEEFIIHQEGKPDVKAWSFKSKKYVQNAVATVEKMLEEDGRELKTNWKAKSFRGPLPKEYRPELDSTDLCDPKNHNRFQQIIGILRWAVVLGREDIHIHVAKMSQYQAQPRTGHLEALYMIIRYLKNYPEKRIVFDPREPSIDESRFQLNADWTEFYHYAKEEDPRGMPTPLGKPVVISCFVDADHAGNKITRRSHTGIFLFVNKALIISYSKKQNTVESATFGSELVAMRIARDLIVSLRIKLKMFGIPIEGPANVFCDNNGVVQNTSIPHSTLNKKHNSINYHIIRESAAAGILRVAKEPTETNLADVLTKFLPWEKARELLSFLYDH